MNIKIEDFNILNNIFILLFYIKINLITFLLIFKNLSIQLNCCVILTCSENESKFSFFVCFKYLNPSFNF